LIQRPPQRTGKHRLWVLIIMGCDHLVVMTLDGQGLGRHVERLPGLPQCPTEAVQF